MTVVAPAEQIAAAAAHIAETAQAAADGTITGPALHQVAHQLRIGVATFTRLLAQHVPPAPNSGLPVTVTMTCEVWINDYAVDTGERMVWDAAPDLHLLDDDTLDGIAAATINGDDLGFDDLYTEACARGVATYRQGPFTLTGDPDQMRAWLAEHRPHLAGQD